MSALSEKFNFESMIVPKYLNVSTTSTSSLEILIGTKSDFSDLSSKTSSFVFLTFSSRKLLEHHSLKRSTSLKYDDKEFSLVNNPTNAMSSANLKSVVMSLLNLISSV